MSKERTWGKKTEREKMNWGEGAMGSGTKKLVGSGTHEFPTKSFFALGPGEVGSGQLQGGKKIKKTLKIQGNSSENVVQAMGKKKNEKGRTKNNRVSKSIGGKGMEEHWRGSQGSLQLQKGPKKRKRIPGTVKTSKGALKKKNLRGTSPH